MKSPIFIVGCERSGTTLLASLLNRHPEIVSTPETHFFSEILPYYFRRNNLQSVLSHPRIQDCFRAGGFTEAEFYDIFSKTPRREIDVLNVIGSLFLQKEGKTRLCEKTPSHIFHVDQILEFYPDAKIVHIVRDGRDVVCSLMEVPWTIKNILENCHRWMRVVKESRRLQQEWGRDVFYQVKFEPLLREPEATLNALMDFLEVSTIDVRSILVPGAETSSVYLDWERDWKSNVHHSLDTGKIGRWKHCFSDVDKDILNIALKRPLLRWGYTVEPTRISFSLVLRVLQLLMGLLVIKLRKNALIFYRKLILRLDLFHHARSG